MRIKHWLTSAETQLDKAGIPSSRLDAELLLGYSLKKDRTWLIAHSDEQVDPAEADTLLLRRLNREPIAYIVGLKEFYGRHFKVTSDTLIPRPETEVMTELLAPLVRKDARLIDVGTGSGAIAITAQLEFPELIVEACDVSGPALEVAKINATSLQADVTFHISDLLSDIAESYDIICANLPYVDASWNVSAETHFEPDLALYANDGGLELIYALLKQAEERLIVGGHILLEADPRQHDDIIAYAHGHGFDWYQSRDYIVVLQRR